MSRIITLHSFTEIQRYGFETTQFYRARIARYLGIDYLHLLTNPQVRPDWKADLKKLGFLEKELICVPHSFSDIGHDSLSVKPETLNLSDSDTLELTADGFVSSLTLGDGSGRYYYTSGPFLFESFKKKELQWFHKNGDLALEGRFIDPFIEPSPVSLFYPEYIFRKDGVIYSEEDLLIKFLVDIAQDTDLIIRDQQSIPKPSLWRYMENTGKNYYEVIHSNVLMNISHANLRKKNNYLVASESLTESLRQLDYNARFLAPIFTEKKGEVKDIGPILDYCLVGHMEEIKNIDLVIEVFTELYKRGSNVHITFYGGSEKRLQQLRNQYNLPPIIQLKGIVNEVPYHLHQCYLSASYTELFANACVEALSQGLLALLSDVEIAHRFYAGQSNAINLFKTKSELIQKIEEMEQPDFYLLNEKNLALASRYSLEKVAHIYRELLDRNF
ncbi:glycosyltransferase [Streptococcus mitis]|uniref:glycosyltransferase n=1 Tax=Streptococcus mitis TaxID=28037 RepID=UPI0039C025BF